MSMEFMHVRLLMRGLIGSLRKSKRELVFTDLSKRCKRKYDEEKKNLFIKNGN